MPTATATTHSANTLVEQPREDGKRPLQEICSAKGHRAFKRIRATSAPAVKPSPARLNTFQTINEEKPALAKKTPCQVQQEQTGKTSHNQLWKQELLTTLKEATLLGNTNLFAAPSQTVIPNSTGMSLCKHHPTDIIGSKGSRSAKRSRSDIDKTQMTSNATAQILKKDECPSVVQNTDHPTNSKETDCVEPRRSRRIRIAHQVSINPTKAQKFNAEQRTFHHRLAYVFVNNMGLVLLQWSALVMKFPCLQEIPPRFMQSTENTIFSTTYKKAVTKEKLEEIVTKNNSSFTNLKCGEMLTKLTGMLNVSRIKKSSPEELQLFRVPFMEAYTNFPCYIVMLNFADLERWQEGNSDVRKPTANLNVSEAILDCNKENNDGAFPQRHPDLNSTFGDDVIEFGEDFKLQTMEIEYITRYVSLIDKITKS